MSTKTTRAQKRTDWMHYSRTERDALRDRAREAISAAGIIGIDAQGHLHLFSMTTREVAVFESIDDTDPDTWALLDEPIEDSPVAWAVHVYKKRGPWLDLRLSKRAAAQLEADQ